MDSPSPAPADAGRSLDPPDRGAAAGDVTRRTMNRVKRLPSYIWRFIKSTFWKAVRPSAFWFTVTAIVIILLGIVFTYLGWGFLRDGTETPVSNSDTIRNAGILIGGVVALLFAIWRSVVAQKQANTAQQSLLNERYQRGVEMLGSETTSVRLGGIHALQRLAEDHPSEYHIQIMLTLCTSVRYWITEDIHQRREDVQTVMDVIGHRTQSQIELEMKDGFTLDLRFAPLRGIELSGTNLSGADLTGAHLWWANLAGANLSGANLTGAKLSNTHLDKVQMSDAVLSGTELHLTTYGETMIWPAEGLTQSQLDQACPNPDNPPKLEGALDPETREPLVWRGKPLDD